MKNNKGFMATSIIYAFFIVFLMILVGLLAYYSNNRILINNLKSNVRDDIDKVENGDRLKNLVLSSYGGKNNITYYDHYEKRTQTTTAYRYINSNDAYETVNGYRRPKTFRFYENYEFNKDTGKYTLTGKYITISLQSYYSAGCGVNGGTSGYRYTNFTTSVISNSSYVNFISSCSSNRINFTQYTSYQTNEKKGLFKMDDDLGTSYFFRGLVENNYVQLGAWDIGKGGYWTISDENDEENIITGEVPIYWRIVRINGDGTVRLVYDGTELYDNASNHLANISYETYNQNKENDFLSIDYDYVLDFWYNNYTNLSSLDYISDSNFCNDREEYESVNNIDASQDIYYSPYNRVSSSTPTLKCGEDYTYTSNDLGYPVGILTVDEAMLAYVGKSPSTESYLYTGSDFWTMSPSSILGWISDGNIEDEVAKMYAVGSDGSIKELNLEETAGIRPVINIKADVLFKGNGTKENPYVLAGGES